RAVGGESFAALARQYSQDPGTAPQGGDLGTFGRGEMVKPFEDAAFALQVGEISDVVETPYGLHVIRLQEKEAPGFEQVKDQFRMRMLNLRFVEAESTYIAGVEERGNLQVAEGSRDVVRELAKDPSTRLSGRAASRALVTFEGGSVTVRDYLNILQEQPAQFREQVQNAPDEQIDNFLNSLGQRKLLVAEAEAAGLSPSPARVDSLVAEARQGVLDVAGEMGLRRLERAPGEAVAPAVGRAVEASLQDVLNGAKDVVPLGGIAFQLRSRQPVSFFDAGLGQVVVNIAQARTARTAPGGGTAPAPDTTGN
ncbi:MAG TPA: peptidylprolyl isomerase, partial [Longimicrobiales bacterium]|nr:peptidylprolyl isomerase [Longimicrobiales bacterium]